MSKKATDILAYLSVLWIAAFLIGDREVSKFHLNQALILLIAQIILSVLIRFLGGLPALIVAILSIIVFFLWLAGLIGAIKGTENPVPFLGGIQILK